MSSQKKVILPLFLLLSVSFCCFADQSNIQISHENQEQTPKTTINNKPIAIDADNQQIDIEKNTITFSGNVNIVQDELTIIADKVVITDMQDSSKQKITAYGKPVKFKQILPEKNKIVTGHASQVIYSVKDNKVTLQGNAHMYQQDNHVSSELITYDVKKQYITAHSNNNARVKSTILPNQVKEMNK